MPYRDDLEAAHARIADLEAQLRSSPHTCVACGGPICCECENAHQHPHDDCDCADCRPKSWLPLWVKLTLSATIGFLIEWVWRWSRG